MKRSPLIFALSVICGTLAEAQVTVMPATNEPPVFTASRTTDSRTESTTRAILDSRFARDWGLNAEEWGRYRELMEGPLGILSPGLDPLTALGIEARTQAEQDHYAELEVRMEGRRVARILAYQRAYSAAWKRLYPTLERINLGALPTGASARADAPRLAVFVREPCPTCDATVRALQAQGRAFDVYVVGLEDDEEIRSWAAKVGIDPMKVRSGLITLNHDAGRWLSVGDETPLPAVFTNVNGQWQRE